MKFLREGESKTCDERQIRYTRGASVVVRSEMRNRKRKMKTTTTTSFVRCVVVVGRGKQQENDASNSNSSHLPVTIHYHIRWIWICTAQSTHQFDISCSMYRTIWDVKSCELLVEWGRTTASWMMLLRGCARDDEAKFQTSELSNIRESKWRKYKIARGARLTQLGDVILRYVCSFGIGMMSRNG